MGERVSPFKFWNDMGPIHRYTPEEDQILREEVSRNPENVSLGILRATERIFNVTGLTELPYPEYKRNKHYCRLLYRWYYVVSKQKVCMALFSKHNLARNRKVQRREKSLAIPIIQTPRFLCTTTTRDFGDMKWN